MATKRDVNTINIDSNICSFFIPFLCFLEINEYFTLLVLCTHFFVVITAACGWRDGCDGRDINAT